MSSEYSEQVDFASRAHNSIRPHLWESPVILKKPPQRVFHTLSFPDQTTTDLQAEKSLIEWYRGSPPAFHISDYPKAKDAQKRLLWDFPYFEKSDEDTVAEFLARRSSRDDWIKSPHHELTIKMLRENIVPSNIGAGCPGEAIPLTTALRHAELRGHRIPRSYFDNVLPISEAEKNAYCAARDLIYRQRGLSVDSAYGPNSTITALTSKYAIPNPDYPDLAPFIVHQLWVLLERGPRVRLVILDIDSESSLNPDRQDKANRRDERLTAMGYEVYHVAGWWCRVDSWRVISEVLSATGVNPNACEQLSCGNLNSVFDYRCSKCHQPVIRWDNYWIAEGEDHEPLHEACYYD